MACKLTNEGMKPLGITLACFEESYDPSWEHNIQYVGNGRKSSQHLNCVSH